MKKTPKFFALLFSFLFICNNAFAQDDKNVLDGLFDNHIVLGAVIGALVAVLMMKFKNNKKK